MMFEYSDNTRQLDMIYGAHINTIVEDCLFLSDMTAATNDDILSKFKITHIINATNGHVPNAFPDKYKYFNVDVEDNEVEEISHYFDRVHEYLNSDEEEKRILFHCRMGVSRSATLLIAFLMKQHDMVLREAFDAVKNRRPKAQPSDIFTDALIKYESSLFPMRESSISFKYMTGRPSSMSPKSLISAVRDSGVDEVTSAEEVQKDRKNDNNCACCIIM